MATDPKQRLTVQDYLALERRAETKSDYLDGELFAMTGASRKLDHYRMIPSLAEVVLVAQDHPPVEHWLRQEDGRWLFEELMEPSQVLDLPSIRCRLALDAAYRRVFS
jgi:Uma2 family endonuclease